MARGTFRSWYSRSWRRKLIDADLARVAAGFRGRVVNVGSRRRGELRPPAHVEWVDLDLVPALRPSLVADAHRMPLRDASVDVVLAAELLEHVEDPRSVVREAARVLKPGGQLVVSVPFHVRIHRDPEDYHRFTDAALRVLVGEWFDVAELKPQGGALSVVGDMVRSFAEQGRPLSTRALPVLTALTAPLVRLERSLGTSEAMRAYTTGYLLVASRRAGSSRDRPAVGQDVVLRPA